MRRPPRGCLEGERPSEAESSTTEAPKARRNGVPGFSPGLFRSRPEKDPDTRFGSRDDASSNEAGWMDLKNCVACGESGPRFPKHGAHEGSDRSDHWSHDSADDYEDLAQDPAAGTP